MKQDFDVFFAKLFIAVAVVNLVFAIGLLFHVFHDFIHSQI